MTTVRLLLPRADARRWHLALCARLESAGLRVTVEEARGAPQPLAMRLCEELERLIYGARGSGLCERVDAPFAEAAADGAMTTLDLSGAPAPAKGAIMPLYDGEPGDAARDAALLDGCMPRLALARESDGRFEILAEGLPAHERPWSLRAGREAIAARILVLATLALRDNARSDARRTRPVALPRKPLTFLVASLVGRARARLARLIAHDQHWRIGWRPLGAEGGAMAQRAWGEDAWTWLADDRQRYYADPFPFEHEGRLYLFCEEYPYATGKAVVSVVAFDREGRPAAPRVVLEADCHLSYPVVFRHDGEIWMMPESSAGHRLDLYRAERFPDRWVRDRTLVAGVAISDATPFAADGRWWLTATVAEEGGSSWDCLSLYSGSSPLGPWTRCGDAPVLVDASCARPAGHVQSIGGALWRPAQDCVGGYGAGLALCRIDHVGEDGFSQTVAARLGPPPGAPPDGVHTLNLGGGFEFIDAVGPQGKRAPQDTERAP